MPYDITLSLTNDCNLACPYCYVEKGTTYMDFETGKKCIDFAYNNLMVASNKYKNLFNLVEFGGSGRHQLKSTIYFFGGEPLLNFQVLKQIVEYAENTYPNSWLFTITTNGTILTDKICKFLEKHNFTLTLSCDGIKEIQDKQRPFRHSKNSSSDQLLQNMELLEKYPILQSRTKLRLTATKENISTFFQSFLYFENLNFQKFGFDLEYFTNWTDEDLNILKDEISKIFLHRYLQYKNNSLKSLKFLMGEEILRQYLAGQVLKLCHLDLKLDTPIVYNNCGYGLEMLCINGKGNFFACHEEPDFIDNKYSNCIGNLNDGVNYGKLNELRENIKNVEEQFLNNRKCINDCILKENNIPCYYTSCPSNLYQTQKIATYNCELKKYCLELILYYSNLLSQEENETFFNYLKTFPSFNVYQDIIAQPEGLIRDTYIKTYQEQIKGNL